jgi:acetolactate synthase-1/2/3 large subunit
MAYLKILREVLPANAIVTDELSQVGFAPGTAFRSTSRAPSSPLAIRARSAPVSRPRSAPRSPTRTRPVVAITGDGGFMFGVQELSTAVQFKIGVVTLVFNNNAYGNVRRDQRERFDGAWWRRTWSIRISSSLRNPSASARRASPRPIISALRWKRRWPTAGRT